MGIKVIALKILCISDQIDPLVYSPSIKERFAGVDLVLCAGDLPLDYLDFIISNLNKPLFFVFGNHFTDKAFPGNRAIHLGSKVKIEENLIIAGLGGVMRSNRGENQYSEAGMFLESVKLIPRLLWNRIFRGRFLDILLTHAPPKGIHYNEDKSLWGFKTFLWFMKTFKPRYLVHGHIHLYDLTDIRCTKWEKTMVINAYGHFVIDTEI